MKGVPGLGFRASDLGARVAGPHSRFFQEAKVSLQLPL